MDYKKIKKPDLINLIKQKDVELIKFKQLQYFTDKLCVDIAGILDVYINEYYKKFIVGKIDENKPIYKELKDVLDAVKYSILGKLNSASSQNINL